MKRALITGITGQDGSYLAELLVREGYQVFGLSRSESPSMPKDFDREVLGSLSFLTGDLTDSDSIERALAESRPHEIYNLAGESHVGRSFENPERVFEVNCSAFGRLVESAHTQNPDVRIYQASSSEMFGTTPSPQSERSPFNPVSPYARAKLQAHHDHVVGSREKHGLYVCSGILFNHESPRRGKEFVTRKITSTLARIRCGSNEVLELGAMDSARDWGYAKEYVVAMHRMLQRNTPDDFVIATGRAHTVREFVTATAQALQIPITWHGTGLEEQAVDSNGRLIVRVNPDFYRPKDVQDLIGNPKKARDGLGWESAVSFDELVAIMAISDLNNV